MESPRLERKLAAILAADVAGYTRLMDLDEKATMSSWWSHREELIDANIAEHRGRIVKLTGDGFLAEFPSAVAAVESAVQIQTEIARRNIDVRRDRRMEFRMGVNLCDIIADDEDIYGHGVNLAARLEALADPGGICISQHVYDQVRHNLDLDYVCLGEQSLKNIDEPVTAYSIRLSFHDPAAATPEKSRRRTPMSWVATIAAIVLLVVGSIGYWVLKEYEPQQVSDPTENQVAGNAIATTGERAARSPALNASGKPSLAVLPFSNISDDPKQEYFVDGMTETLITDLSKLSHLYVSSRNAVLGYKGMSINIQKVADELGVLYLLEGSVQISGNRVRINVQLIDAYGGGHVWAERYDGVRDDVFALQDEVTRQIVSALAVKLTPGEARDLGQKETQSVAAYDEFQKGWALYQRSTPTDLAAAVRHIESAIKKDPLYSRAHAVLAAIYEKAWSQRWHGAIDLSSDEALKKANQHLAGAMKPPTPLAHQVASTLHYFAGEYDRSIEEADRAIALAPDDAGGYFAMAKALIYAGRPQEGIENLYTAMELNPEYPPEYLRWLGMGRFFSENLEQAALSLKRASKLLPEDINTHLLLVATYGYLGRLDDAERALAKLNELQVKSGSRASGFDFDSWPLKQGDDRERLREGIRLAGASG